MEHGIIMQNGDTLVQQPGHFVTKVRLVTSHVYHNNAEPLQCDLQQAHPQEAHCYVPTGLLP
jgi:hypothetical protein